MNSEQLRLIHRCAHRLLCGGTSLIWGLEVQGMDLVPRTGRTIIAVNHVHWMDPLIAAFALSWVRMPYFMAKQELFRNPVFARVLRYVGVIPLDRSRADLSAVRFAIEVLEREGCMVIFPEGTRARGGVPGKPKHGVSFLAHRTGAPVIPARVRNTERFPALVPMSIRFGPPVRYEGGEGREAYQGFAERVMERIFRL